MRKRKVIKSNLKELLNKRGMDNKTLHKITKVREATIGEMVNNTNKSFVVDNLNSIINALNIENIEELLTIVDEEDIKKDTDR
ncbi:hypothetical protein GCM10023310_70300 [Paenibacillus vulneris]|uniref:Helix-turn-helix domain-containing protein n=1 Tax=Paenibacillus vulneris TaxID=1133364 RepID=A0ABW3UJ39_9BACL